MDGRMTRKTDSYTFNIFNFSPATTEKKKMSSQQVKSSRSEEEIGGEKKGKKELLRTPKKRSWSFLEEGSSSRLLLHDEDLCDLHVGRVMGDHNTIVESFAICGGSLQPRGFRQSFQRRG